MATHMERSSEHTSKDSSHVYTTVGSIYNPQSAPLQPPTRRGRFKWPSLLDAANKTSSTASHHDILSPPPKLHTFQQYSPLQQNSDRAISPGFRCSSASVRVAPRWSDDAPKAAATGANAAQDQTDLAGSDDEDDMDIQHLRPMSIKSLTNLASYPNPMQKTAQKIISRARPSNSFEGTALGNTGNLHSDSDIFNANKRFSESGERARRATGGPLDQQAHTQHYQALETGFARRAGLDDGFVPEMPRPLRQQERLLPAALANWDEIHVKSTSHIDADGDMAQAFKKSSTAEGLKKMVDTLPVEQAHKYYPNGLPLNFNRQTSWIEPDWSSNYPSDNFRSYTKTCLLSHGDGFMIDRYGKARDPMFFKTINEVVRDRDFQEAGVEQNDAEDAEMLSYRIATSTTLTVEAACSMPTSEHVVPLLSMTYQSLLKYADMK